MLKKEIITTECILVRKPLNEVFAFHVDINNISKVLPFFMHVRVLRLTWPLKENSQVTLHFSLFGILSLFKWKLKFIQFDKPFKFTDEECGGCFIKFQHSHNFRQAEVNSSETIIEDEIVHSLGDSLWLRMVNMTFLKSIVMIFLKSKLAATKKFLEAN